MIYSDPRHSYDWFWDEGNETIFNLVWNRKISLKFKSRDPVKRRDYKSFRIKYLSFFHFLSFQNFQIIVLAVAAKLNRIFGWYHIIEAIVKELQYSKSIIIQWKTYCEKRIIYSNSLILGMAMLLMFALIFSVLGIRSLKLTKKPSFWNGTFKPFCIKLNKRYTFPHALREDYKRRPNKGRRKISRQRRIEGSFSFKTFVEIAFF